MSPTEAQLSQLKHDWNNQKSNLTLEEFGETVEKLEDQLEQER